MFTPMVRHYMNLASYGVLTALQFWTSQYHSSNHFLWNLVFMWSLSNMFQTLASPTTGYFSLASMLDDVILVVSHFIIFYKVLMGGEVPRDLDAVTMILHFGNLTKGLIVHPKMGPLIIMVLTMIGDITQFAVLMAFFVACFYCSLNALFRGVPGVYVGEQWLSPSTLLVNAIWGPQVLWMTAHEDTARTLFMSEVLGMNDSSAIDTMGAIIVALSVLCIPIMLLNLLIAIMASTYAALSLDVDAEYKRSFASCVLVARELPCLPMPLSLPQDIARCASRVYVVLLRSHSAKTEGSGASLDVDVKLKEQLAVGQIVSNWEAQCSIEKFKGMVTIEQVERMRTQSDSLQDRIHVLYSALLNLVERQDKMEVNLAQMISKQPMNAMRRSVIK
mmetsp:Transcript_78127/g.252613  ORF Transcript_78127/g.252613 Transcript_78127/m.252613 type:complete len:390 (-) Transcript_78127:138-1307(-)